MWRELRSTSRISIRRTSTGAWRTSAGSLALAKDKGVKFLLPIDDVETLELKAGAQSRNTPAHASGQGITDGWQAVDIGRETIAQYKVEIHRVELLLSSARRLA